MLTLQKLKDLNPGIFATGIAIDEPNGLFMARTGKELRWVAVRGSGIHDWVIYCHFSDKDEEWIRSYGDKVYEKRHIRKLVPCNDEAFKMYRY